MSLATKFEQAAFDTRRAAAYIGMSRWFLINARKTANVTTSEGPTCIRIGRSVRYMKTDLDAFLAKRRRAAETEGGYVAQEHSR